MESLWIRVLEETGLRTIWHSSRDVKLLCAQRFVRLFAYGGSTLILASYLSALEIPDDRIGLFMTLTLAGDVVISFLLTLFADAMGRKAVLALGSVLMTGSGVVFGLFGDFWILLVAAVLGVISPRFVFPVLDAFVECMVVWFTWREKEANADEVVGMKSAHFAPSKNRLWLIWSPTKPSVISSPGTLWEALQARRWG